MHAITAYKFGGMEIDGKPYSQDVIILRDRIIASWWRKEGHLLQPEDMSEIIHDRPEILVVGQGAFGEMKISDGAKALLKENGIELAHSNTEPACRIYNEYKAAGKKVAGAFHLTC